MKVNICISLAWFILFSYGSAGGEEVWKTYPSHFVRDIAFAGDTIWCATNHGVLKWDRRNRACTAFTIRDGLPADFTLSIAVGKNGVVWCGTSAGLARYDGASWKVYRGMDYGLPTDRVTVCRVDSEGVLWCGTDNGAFRFDGKAFQAFTEKEGLVSNGVNAIAVDHDNVKWFGTTGGVSSFDGQTWKSYTTANGLANNVVSSVAVDRNNVKWFGTGSRRGGTDHHPVFVTRLTRFDGDKWQSFSSHLAAPMMDEGEKYADIVITIAIAPDNTLWCGKAGGGVYLWDGKYHEFSTPPLDYPALSALAVDPGGKIWFGTSHGLASWDGVTWDLFNAGPFSCDVSAIATDGRVIWCGGNTPGLSRFDGNVWQSFSTVEGYLLSVSGLLLDKKGALWVGNWVAVGEGESRKGLLRFDGSSWEYFLREYFLREYYITALAYDEKNDVLWVGTETNGLIRFDGQEWQGFSTLNSTLPSNEIHAVALDRNGTAWVSSGDNIVRVDGSEIGRVFPLSDGQVTAIGCDNENTLWFGSAKGYLLRWNGAEVVNRLFLGDGRIKSIAADRGNSLWIASYGSGLFCLSGMNLRHYTEKDGLINAQVQWVTVDRDNVKWIGFYGINVGRPEESGGLMSLSDTPLSVEDTETLPNGIALRGNFPNPFNLSTTIEFTLDAPGIVILSIYSPTGQKIRDLRSGLFSAGLHSLVWDGKDELNIAVSSGAYFAKLRSGKWNSNMKMLLLK